MKSERATQGLSQPKLPDEPTIRRCSACGLLIYHVHKIGWVHRAAGAWALCSSMTAPVPMEKS